MPSRQHKKFGPLKPVAGRKLRTNPYFKTRRPERIKTSRLKGLLVCVSPRCWAYTVLVLMVVGGLIWLIIFSQIFIIKKIEVSGVPAAEKINFEKIAWQQSTGNRARFLSQSRLFVFSSQTLERTINNSYALNRVQIVKKLPSTLQIKITEKTPAVVWFEADLYYLIDADGWIIRQLTGPAVSLPVIYNNGLAQRSDKQIIGQARAIAAAIVLQTEFKGRFSQLAYKQFVVDDSRNTLTVVLNKGPLLYLATDTSIVTQLDRFDLLLKQQLKDEMPKLHYIDLRYGDKIYYK